MSLCDWSATMSQGKSLEILETLALSHARESGPYSTALIDMLERRDWVAICKYEPDYNIGASASSVLAMRQTLGFFTKLESLDVGVDKERAAYAKFVEAEDLCRQTNQMFRMRRNGRFSFPRRVEAAISAARRKIAKVLGPCPKLADLRLGFGPGATVSTRKCDANPLSKMAGGLRCSTDLLASGLLPELLREVPHWCDALDTSKAYSIDEEGWLVETVDVAIEPGRLEFVPKSAFIYRTMVVEPCLNGFAQHGLGDLIARLLRLVGVDVRDQTVNQRLALEGSITGHLATIDLSSASDTICRELVRALLPADWYKLLAAFRTSEVTYRGETIALEKFSSMGNGFTFPLETLIFWALTRSTVPEGTVSTYGDDIICPSSYYDEVAEVLTCAGFVINQRKSYSKGPFRESCGCDYYNGINVRPFYQKDLVSWRSMFVLHNWYTRKSDLERAAIARHLIPRPLRIYGPDGYGDGHLVSDEYPIHHSRRALRSGWGGHFFETFSPISKRVRNKYPGDWVSPLYSVYARDTIPAIPLPDTPCRKAESDPYDAPQGYIGSREPTGAPTWSVPGVEGYKKTLIYILG